MNRRSWLLLLAAGVGAARGADLPPAEVLDRLAFFESMHLLEDLDPPERPAGTEKELEPKGEDS